MNSRQQQFNNSEFRRRQIDTLKVFNDNVVELTEGEEYAVQFQSGGRSLALNVHIGTHFPNERPKLTVSPPCINHPWVNADNGEVERAPGLLNYSPHSDLGRVVQAIIREYERHPPPNIVSSSAEFDAMQKYHSATDNNSKNKSALSARIDKLNHVQLPNLSDLCCEELHQLDNDSQFFNDFIEEMPVVQQLNEDLDSLISHVETMSRDNNLKKNCIIELKQKLNCGLTELRNLGERCDLLNKNYLKKSDNFAPQHIRELLQIACSNADGDCDRSVEQFLNKKIDVQTFLSNYTYSKKISSERKAKEERLGHQLAALELAGTQRS